MYRYLLLVGGFMMLAVFLHGVLGFGRVHELLHDLNVGPVIQCALEPFKYLDLGVWVGGGSLESAVTILPEQKLLSLIII